MILHIVPLRFLKLHILSLIHVFNLCARATIICIKLKYKLNILNYSHNIKKKLSINNLHQPPPPTLQNLKNSNHHHLTSSFHIQKSKLPASTCRLDSSHHHHLIFAIQKSKLLQKSIFSRSSKLCSIQKKFLRKSIFGRPSKASSGSILDILP